MIPARVDFTLDVRSPDDAVRHAMVRGHRGGMRSSGCEARRDPVDRTLHGFARDAHGRGPGRTFEEAVRSLGHAPLRLPPAPATTRSPWRPLPVGDAVRALQGGISHNPAESITVEDAESPRRADRNHPKAGEGVNYHIELVRAECGDPRGHSQRLARLQQIRPNPGLRIEDLAVAIRDPATGGASAAVGPHRLGLAHDRIHLRARKSARRGHRHAPDRGGRGRGACGLPCGVARYAQSESARPVRAAGLCPLRRLQDFPMGRSRTSCRNASARHQAPDARDRDMIAQRSR